MGRSCTFFKKCARGAVDFVEDFFYESTYKKNSLCKISAPYLIPNSCWNFFKP